MPGLVLSSDHWTLVFSAICVGHKMVFVIT